MFLKKLFRVILSLKAIWVQKFILGLTLGVIVFSMLFGLAVMAQNLEFVPNVTIPGDSGFTAGVTSTVDNTFLARYIKSWYKFGVGLAGILAVLMIAYGGVVWLFSGGDSGKIGKAKEFISGAVIGLVLALGSYFILNTVNPELVNLSLKVDGITNVDLILTRFNLPFCPTSGQTDICGNKDAEKKCWHTNPGLSNICLVESNVVSLQDVKEDNVDFNSITGSDGRFIKINKGFIDKGGYFDEPQIFVPDKNFFCGSVVVNGSLFGGNYRVGSDCNSKKLHCVIYGLGELAGQPGFGGNSIEKTSDAEFFGYFKYSDCYNNN